MALSDADFFSPAGNIADAGSPGGGSTPAPPTYYPDPNPAEIPDRFSAAADGSTDCEAFAGQGPTPGSTPGVQLAVGPPMDAGMDGGPGSDMSMGLGTPPRP